MKNVRVYQIDSAVDEKQVKFQSLKRTMDKNQEKKVDPNIYKQVFSGNFPNAEHLEDIFAELNTDTNPVFHGHSMSVSDVIVTEDGAFYCDSIGFEKIDFDEGLTHKDNNLNRIVYVAPGEEPFVTEIPSDLHAEQRAVGGYIELIYNDDGTILVGNDEAKLCGMPGNRHLDGGGVIAGPFFVIGDDGEDLRSLTDEEVEKYLNKYAEPEMISQTEVMNDMGFVIITG